MNILPPFLFGLVVLGVFATATAEADEELQPVVLGGDAYRSVTDIAILRVVEGGRFGFTASREGTIGIWNLETGERFHSHSVDAPASIDSFHVVHGGHIAIGFGDGTFALGRVVEDGVRLDAAAKVADFRSWFHVSAASTHLAARTGDGIAVVPMLEGGSRLTIDERENIVHLDVGGPRLAYLTRSGRFKVWDLVSGTIVAHWDIGARTFVYTDPSSQDFPAVAHARHREVVARDRISGRVLFRVRSADKVEGIVEVFPSGESILRTVAGLDSVRSGDGLSWRIRLGDARRFPDARIGVSGDRLHLAHGRCIWQFDRTGEWVNGEAGHLGPVRRLRFLKGGRRLLSAGDDGTIRRWDLDKRRLETTTQVAAVGIMGSGERLFPGPGNHRVHSDGERVFRLSASGRVEAIVSGGDGFLRFSGDGAAVARIVGDEVLVVSCADGERVGEVQAPGEGKMTDACLTADAELLCLLWKGPSGRAAVVFRVRDGEEVGRIPLERTPARFAFSRSGNRICFLARMGLRAFVRDQRGWRQDLLVRGRIRSWAFNAQDTTVAVVYEDEAVGLVDATTGDIRVLLDHRMGGITCLRFSPDSSRLAAGTEDGRILVWDLRNVPAKGGGGAAEF